MKEINNVTYTPLIRFFIFISILFLSFYVFLIYDNSIKYILIFIVGIIYAILSELMHDTLHDVFVSSKKLNYFFGYIMGFCNFISYSYYKKGHLEHHKNLGTEKDYDITAVNEKGQMSIKEFFYNFFSINRLIYTFNNYLTFNTKVKVEFGSLLLILTIWGFIDIYSLLFLYIIPILFIKSPLNFIIQFPEHYKTETLSKNIFNNTREIEYNYLYSFLTNGNNFHCTHHKYPNYQSCNLLPLHNKLKTKFKYIEKSGIYFFIRELKIIFSNKI